MKRKKLLDIANIHSGLVLSRKEATDYSEKTFKYQRLNLRAISDDGAIDLAALDEFLSEENLYEQQFITAKDDIVMRLFSPFIPVLITKNSVGLIVPSQFAIIRIKAKETILPAFLCQYLLQPEAASFIAAQEVGQTIRSIKISTLSNIEVPIPSLAKQQLIVELMKTNSKRKNLYLDLLKQYDIQANHSISKIIGGN